MGGVLRNDLRALLVATARVCHDVFVGILAFNVLILDDHVLLAQALANCLSGLDDVGDVMVAGTPEEAAAYVATAAPEVVLVDYRLNGSFGTDFIKDMKRLGSTSEFVVLTATDSAKVRRGMCHP